MGNVIQLGEAIKSRYPDKFGELSGAQIANLGRAFRRRFPEKFGEIADVTPGTELLGGELPPAGAPPADAVPLPDSNVMRDLKSGAGLAAKTGYELGETAIKGVNQGLMGMVEGLGAMGPVLANKIQEEGKKELQKQNDIRLLAGQPPMEQSEFDAKLEGVVTDGLNTIGNGIRDFARSQTDKAPDRARAGESFIDNPELLLNPDYIVNLMGQGVGSIAGMLAFGQLAGSSTIAQVGLGSLFETLADAGQNYHEAIEQHGASPKDAADVFATTVRNEFPTTAAFNAVGLYNPKVKGAVKSAFSALGESFQEVSQGVAGRSATNEVLGTDIPLMQGAETEALAGALGGGVVGPMIGGGHRVEPIAEQAPDSSQPISEGQLPLTTSIEVPPEVQAATEKAHADLKAKAAEKKAARKAKLKPKPKPVEKPVVEPTPEETALVEKAVTSEPENPKPAKLEQKPKDVPKPEQGKDTQALARKSAVAGRLIGKAEKLGISGDIVERARSFRDAPTDDAAESVENLAEVVRHISDLEAEVSFLEGSLKGAGNEFSRNTIERELKEKRELLVADRKRLAEPVQPLDAKPLKREEPKPSGPPLVKTALDGTVVVEAGEKTVKIPASEAVGKSKAELIEQAGLGSEKPAVKPEPVVKPEAQAPVKPKTSAVTTGAAPNLMLGEGDTPVTSSGRKTSPHPKIDTGSIGKTTNSLRRQREWLQKEAIAEAESRGDKFNLTQFRGLNPKNWSDSDTASVNEYLFGEQPRVVPSILKDLKPAANILQQQVAEKKAKAEAALEARREKLKPKKAKAGPVDEVTRSLERKGVASKGDTSAKIVTHPSDDNAFAVEVTRLGNREIEPSKPLTIEEARKKAAALLDEGFGARLKAEAAEAMKAEKKVSFDDLTPQARVNAFAKAIARTTGNAADANEIYTDHYSALAGLGAHAEPKHVSAALTAALPDIDYSISELGRAPRVRPSALYDYALKDPASITDEQLTRGHSRVTEEEVSRVGNAVLGRLDRIEKQADRAINFTQDDPPEAAVKAKRRVQEIRSNFKAIEKRVKDLETERKRVDAEVAAKETAAAAKIAMTPIKPPKGGLPKKKLTKTERSLLLEHDLNEPGVKFSVGGDTFGALERLEKRGLASEEKRELTEAGLDLARYMQGQSSRLKEGIPIAEHVPNKNAKPEEGVVGWYVNKVDGADWFSNGHGLWKGAPPAPRGKEAKIAPEGIKPDFTRVIPSSTGLKPVFPIAYRDNGNENGIARFIHFGPGEGPALNADMYDFTVRTYGDKLVWKVAEKTDALSAYRGDELVAVIMPMREAYQGPGLRAIREAHAEATELKKAQKRGDAGFINVDLATFGLASEGAQAAVKAVVDQIRPLGSRLAAEGQAGKDLMGLIEKAGDIGEVEAGKAIAKLEDAEIRKLKRDERFNLMEALEGRGEPGNAKVQRVYDAVREVFDLQADVAGDLGVLTKAKMVLKPEDPLPPGVKLTQLQQRRRADGETIRGTFRRRFIRRKHFYPRIIRDAEQLSSGHAREDVIDNLLRMGVRQTRESATTFLDAYLKFMNTGGRQNALVEYLVETGQAENTAEALHSLQSFRKRTIKRQGSLEYARNIDLPFWDPDPLRVIPGHVLNTSKRLARIRLFGQDNQKINKLIDQIRKTNGNADFARAAVDRILDITNKPDDGVAKLSRLVRTLNGFKLGLASIPNATQGALNTLLAGDLRAVMAGAKGLASKQGRRLGTESGASVESVINETLREVGGSHERLGQFLKATGFTATERWNRIFAANAGADYAHRMQRRLRLNRNDTRARSVLDKLGLDADAVAARGHLTPDEVLQAAKKFSDITQFRARPEDLPMFASTEMGKVFFQFKSFIYNQTRLIGDETLGELKARRPGQATKAALKLAIVFPAAGALINVVRALIRGEELDDKLKLDWDNYWDAIGQAGSLGIFQDMLTSGAYGKGVNALVGPTVSDVGDFINAVSGKNKVKNLTKWAFRRFPLAGQVFYQRVFPKKGKAVKLPKDLRDDLDLGIRDTGGDLREDLLL